MVLEMFFSPFYRWRPGILRGWLLCPGLPSDCCHLRTLKILVNMMSDARSSPLKLWFRKDAEVTHFIL